MTEYRYEQVAIHTCEECGELLHRGCRVVTLSDGYVDRSMSYSPDNIRFFHVECWKESDYMDVPDEGSNRYGVRSDEFYYKGEPAELIAAAEIDGEEHLLVRTHEGQKVIPNRINGFGESLIPDDVEVFSDE